MKMKLGCFGYLENFFAIEAAGYDHAELDVLEIMKLDDGQYRELRSGIKNSPVICDTYNTMIPLNCSIISSDFDEAYWREFSKIGAYKTAELGAKYYVFGNGHARRIPEAGDIAGGREKVLGFLNTLCDITEEYGITMLIEPLSTRFSNFMLSIKEAVDVIRELGRKNLMTMVDMRHMVTTGESFDEIIKYKDYVVHAHIDNPLHTERYFPRIGDGYDYQPFFDALKKINFGGILSVEARHYMNGELKKDFAVEAAKTMDFFKAFDITGYRGTRGCNE